MVLLKKGGSNGEICGCDSRHVESSTTTVKCAVELTNWCNIKDGFHEGSAQVHCFLQ